VRFDVEASAAFSDAQRQRVISKVGSVIVVSADDERSQLRNRRLALERLRVKLERALRVETPRRPTRPGKGAVERRLDAKRRQASRKQERRRNFED
jgi:ribosome-associated protein